ncbi:exodeoxyribonuclease VII small subunit [Faecalibacillus intestinalis]|uniref:exodeoxyribonuclease VII small subunit n=1 Tax=Faecalibacillus intestinalis TaxID=1982626 RepID=UPI0018AC75C6|nr:exodeoxyribonuclease VII small subunit [Faecalibacillus intestinalis]
MEKMTFEQAIKRLEEIVDLLENNETSLDDSVELFQEGVQLSQYCSKKLVNVENKVSKILIDGQLEDFDVEVENNE